MARIYWTTIAGTASATLWAVYLYLKRDVLSDNEISLVALFILNLAILILIREKWY